MRPMDELNAIELAISAATATGVSSRQGGRRRTDPSVPPSSALHVRAAEAAFAAGPSHARRGLPRRCDRRDRRSPRSNAARPHLRPARAVPADRGRCRGRARGPSSRCRSRAVDTDTGACCGRRRAGPDADARGHVLRGRQAGPRRDPHRPGVRSAGPPVGGPRDDDPRGVARLACRSRGCPRDAARRAGHGRGAG